MNVTRRAVLIGGLSCGLTPVRALAQTAEDEHRPIIEVPTLSEDPGAVPLQISVNHPMEPDHFIRSIDVRLDRDPVPYKGKILFTPANGRAAVAFQMRSGTGGLLKVTAECSKHGRAVATKEIRVAEGGCAGPVEAARDRLGNPRLYVPESVKSGEIIQLRAKVDHNSYTGLVLKAGKYVREGPEFYVKQMLVYFDTQLVSEFQMTSAVSANPLIRFPLKASRSGTLRVVFVNSEGQRWETSKPLRV
jgi:predicted secreted protein